jgi:integrase
VLKPIWREKTETASRLRGRIEAVLNYATAHELRTGENPARYKGHLAHLLGRADDGAVKHHAALAYSDVGAFMTAVATKEGVSARALEFIVLTAARSGEVREARWDEIDLAARVWTIPGERMKGKREHRVPLSDAALAVLAKMERRGEYVFAGRDPRKPVANMSIAEMLKSIAPDVTIHGFRSSFRDWAAEATAYPRDVCEMALAHTISDKVEAAYRRGDLFEKRARLMEDWGAFCSAPSRKGEVVPIRAQAQ